MHGCVDAGANQWPGKVWERRRILDLFLSQRAPLAVAHDVAVGGGSACLMPRVQLRQATLSAPPRGVHGYSMVMAPSLAARLRTARHFSSRAWAASSLCTYTRGRARPAEGPGSVPPFGSVGGRVGNCTSFPQSCLQRCVHSALCRHCCACGAVFKGMSRRGTHARARRERERRGRHTQFDLQNSTWLHLLHGSLSPVLQRNSVSHEASSQVRVHGSALDCLCPRHAPDLELCSESVHSLCRPVSGTALAYHRTDGPARRQKSRR
eukprot:COSAG01_NODE_7516_length_3172_cov_2.105434_4_plen_265_part_00